MSGNLGPDVALLTLLAVFSEGQGRTSVQNVNKETCLSSLLFTRLI